MANATGPISGATAGGKTSMKRRANGSAAEAEYGQQILEAMIAFRSGDLSQRLPAGWSGVFGKIADAFNEVASLNDRRVQENRRVCPAAGEEGKVRHRLRGPRAARPGADRGAPLHPPARHPP